MKPFAQYPATIQMLDPTRGDLFAVLTEKSHYVVRLEDHMPGSESTVGSFRRGFVGIDAQGNACFLRLATYGSYSPCQPLHCTTDCSACGNVMRPAGGYFVCTSCGETV